LELLLVDVKLLVDGGRRAAEADSGAAADPRGGAEEAQGAGGAEYKPDTRIADEGFPSARLSGGITSTIIGPAGGPMSAEAAVVLIRSCMFYVFERAATMKIRAFFLIPSQ
jgi:hypothetical protein